MPIVICIYLIFISLLFFTIQHNIALSTPLSSSANWLIFTAKLCISSNSCKNCAHFFLLYSSNSYILQTIELQSIGLAPNASTKRKH